jgi:adenylate cyclase
MADREVKRRLAAILAADVAGYTRLMENDTDGTVAAWQDAREEVIKPNVAAYSGKIVKLTGDGFLVEFPTVQDAVNCAITMQHGLVSSSLNFRMGINMGDIVDDGEDIHGEGVNVAARLEGLAEPGGICISGDVYNQVRNRIDANFEDRGEQEVKNVSAPVKVFAIRLQDPAGVSASAAQNIADKPSIAVLPFDNLSGDPEQEYFSDGMAEDLITDFSKISNLYVAARNSSFLFKGQMPDVRDVAEKLGVAYVLEGSVRKMGERLRTNAQLIDAADGDHLWAERYDGNMDEIFDFQDRIRAEIVAALELKLTPYDKALSGRKPTDNLEAYDLFLKGRASYHRYTPELLLEGRACLEKAIEIDPEFADAHGWLSYCHFQGWATLWPGFDDSLERAIELAERGVALDGSSAIALTRLGWIQNFLRRYDSAIANLEKAIALAPDSADVNASFGQVLN